MSGGLAVKADAGVRGITRPARSAAKEGRGNAPAALVLALTARGPQAPKQAGESLPEKEWPQASNKKNARPNGPLDILRDGSLPQGQDAEGGLGSAVHGASRAGCGVAARARNQFME